MKLNDVFNQQFSLLNSDFSVAQAKSFLGTTNNSYQIIITDDKNNQHYLEQLPDFLNMIGNVNGKTKLRSVFKTINLKPTPVFETNMPVAKVAGKAIVIQQGNVVGYFDPFKAPDTATRAPKRTARAKPPAQANRIPQAAGNATAEKVAKDTFFVNARYSEKASLNESFSVRVNLGRKASGTTSIPLVLDINSELDIVAEAKTGFEVIGRDHNTIKVLDKDESDSINFKFKPLKTGEGKIRIMAFVDGTELGHIDLITQISDLPLEDNKIATKSSTAIELENYSLPDLVLQISESENNGKTSLLFRLTSSEKLDMKRIYLKPYGPLTLRLDPASYFDDIFKEIEDLPDNNDKKVVLKKLEAKGLQLFNELLPEELQKLIWSVRDKIKVLKIDSDEPWIPWEIFKLSGEEGNLIQEGPFFCEAFEITRWIPGHGAPRSKIDLSKMAMVVPKDSELAYAEKEKTDIKKILGKKSSIDEIPAKLIPLTNAFSKPTYTAWHFSGHGAFQDADDPAQSKMVLEDNDEIDPGFLNGKAANMGRSGPIVFFNACQIGKSAMGLTGIGGWASQFLSIGAACFIGAYWAVSDELAYKFAVSLYNDLLQGTDIGKAFKNARLKIKEDGDPTWLAYTVFADPFARVSK